MFHFLFLPAVSVAKACDHGKYGNYCNETCNCNCSNNMTCNSVTGECPLGCHQGNVLMLVLTFSFIGVILIISIIFVCVMVIKRSRKRKTSDQQFMCASESQDQGSSLSYSNSVVNEAVEESKETKYRIHISDLERHVVQGKKNGTLKQEFEFIVKNSTSCHPCSVGESKANERKNRYSSVLPYDHTRVILEKLPNDPHSDYINANYIDGYKNPKKYIAAQGPKPLRMADFWRMVWEQGSCKIVMVTNLIEGGETKCKKYWPKKTDHYGNLKIQMVDSNVHVNFIIRNFILTRNGKTQEVKQFHFTTWQEKKIPLYTKSLLRFIRKVRDYQPLHKSPIIVHSSAGTGRTGAYILLDYMLDMIQWESHVDFVKCVCEMREQRINMVETAEQYIFIYEALLDACWPVETSIHCYKFNAQMKITQHVNLDFGLTQSEEEFERINRLYPLRENVNNETRQIRWLNKSETCYPLSSCLFTENAESKPRPLIFIDVDGYFKRKALLVTAFPNTSQMREFWNNIYHTNTQTIVLLNDLQSFVEKGLTRYWPREGNVINFGEFSLEYIDKERNEDIVTRNFKLTDNENKSPKGKPITRRLKHFHLTNWNSKEKVPPSPMLLVKLIATVEKWQQETPKHSVVVQCLDGIRASGLFCACLFMCNKIKLEQEVDVYQAVRVIRENFNAIEDLEQYIFCYRVAQSFLEKFRDYANFW